MEDQRDKALEIFSPYYLERAEYVRKKGLRFVYYTSAETAMNIIKNGEVWLRNAQCMNDFSEIEHGMNCLATAFTNETHGSAFKTFLNELFPGMVGELISSFNAWMPHFESSTYIACVSEHSDAEDQFGRLSMWRAYGGRNSVALVLNTAPFFAETDVFEAYAYPVEYIDNHDYGTHLDSLRERMSREKEYLLDIGKQGTLNYLFHVFKYIVICTKHPGFEEEREWRVVYTPKYKQSEYVDKAIETIDTVPQEVHKIPLRDIPEHGFTGASIPDLINRIIIGPNDHQLTLVNTFTQLLKNRDCEDAEKRIFCSGIPLR